MAETNWQTECARLQREFDAYRAGVEAERALEAKRRAYRALLEAERIPARLHDRILRLVDFDGIALDGEGLSDPDAQRAAIRAEWGEYAVDAAVRGIAVDTPPDARRLGDMTVEEIMAIKDDAKREREIARHHEMFGF